MRSDNRATTAPASRAPAARPLGRALALLCAFCLQTAAAQQSLGARPRLEGVVRDQAAAPVAGAEIALRGDSQTLNTTTDEDGRFFFTPETLTGAEMPTARLTLGLQGRASGAQFDDDQNRLRLGRYFTLDALASKQLSPHADLFAAAENLFDRRYDIGRTPVRTLGPPLSVRFVLRLRLGAR